MVSDGQRQHAARAASRRGANRRAQIRARAVVGAGATLLPGWSSAKTPWSQQVRSSRAASSPARPSSACPLARASASRLSPCGCGAWPSAAGPSRASSKTTGPPRAPRRCAALPRVPERLAGEPPPVVCLAVRLAVARLRGGLEIPLRRALAVRTTPSPPHLARRSDLRELVAGDEVELVVDLTFGCAVDPTRSIPERVSSFIVSCSRISVDRVTGESSRVCRSEHTPSAEWSPSTSARSTSLPAASSSLSNSGSSSLESPV